MKKNLKNINTEVEDLFKRPPSVEQKAWGVINEFYHLILTYMERNEVSQAELARRLNKSRSAISQMFKKNPNVSVKKMVEIADAVGIDINIISKEIKDYQPVFRKIRTEYVFVPVHPNIMEYANVDLARIKTYSNRDDSSLKIETEQEWMYPC